ATFYGLLTANLVLLPIAEKLAAVSSSDAVMRAIIKEGVLMMAEKRHPTFIMEYLQSFLAPGYRIDTAEAAPATSCSVIRLLAATETATRTRIMRRPWPMTNRTGWSLMRI
ncbi:MAG TPA: hypothetical protein PL182_10580, partial [Pseudobdellovibrionaceae bacterium]|nr:hypothetical protein [Pseudobdellovibrionaceae bacterium]